MGVRQNSYSEAARHLAVVFQTGKPVQEYEINEAQFDVLNMAASAVKHSCGSGVGYYSPSLGSPAANQLQVFPAVYVVDGIYVDQTAPVTITGLTTPGASRTDNLYLELQIQEIDDPNPISPLGVTSKRKQLSVSFKVVEGGAVPASTGRLLDGGIQRLALYEIVRPISTNPLAGTQTPKYTLLPAQVFAQITTQADGKVQTILAGAQGLVDASATALGFHDANMSPARVNLTDAIDAAGGKLLLGQAHQKTGVTPTSTSILRKLNGRAFLTCGDGTNSFGDFNGNDAPIDALNAFWTAFPDHPVTLFLKRGKYNLSATLTCIGPVKIIGESARGSGSGLADGAVLARSGVVVSSTLPLEIENVRIEGGDIAIQHVAGTNLSYLRLRGCEVIGTTYYAPAGGTDEPGLLIDDSSLESSGSSVDGPVHVAIQVTGTGTRVKISASKLSASAIEAGLLTYSLHSGVGSALASFLEVVGCDLQVSDNTDNTSPQRTTGLLRFKDSAAIDISIRRVVFRDCNIRSDSGPWWNLCPGKSDGSAAFSSSSSIESLIFDNCEFLNVGGYSNGELFAYRARTSFTRLDAVQFSRCTFRIDGNSVGQNPELSGTGDKAVVVVRAHRVVVRDCVATGFRDGVFSDATASTNYRAWFHFSPLRRTATGGVDYGSVLVDGLEFSDVRQIGAGTTATAALSVQTEATDTRNTIDIQRVSAMVSGANSKFAYMIQVLSHASRVTVRDCALRSSDYLEAGLDCRPLAGAGSEQNICVENNKFENVMGPQYVSSSFDYSVVVVRGNRISAGGTTALEEGLSIGSTGTGGVLEASSNSVYGFASYGISASGGHVSLQGNMCRANNADAVQIRVVAMTTVCAIGNSCLTAAGAATGLDLTPAAAAPTAATHVGADTRDVNTLQTFTNNGDMRFNNAKLVH